MPILTHTIPILVLIKKKSFYIVYNCESFSNRTRFIYLKEDRKELLISLSLSLSGCFLDYKKNFIYFCDCKMMRIFRYLFLPPFLKKRKQKIRRKINASIDVFFPPYISTPPSPLSKSTYLLEIFYL